MRVLRVAIGAVSVIVFAACSSSSKASVAPATTRATSTTAEATTTLPPATKPLAARGPAYVYHLEFGGRARDYRLHVPPAATSGKPLPLVLNLHGDTQNGELEELQTGMDASSDRDGYLVAYPDGTRIAKTLTPDPVAKDAQYGWDAGNCCGLPATLHVDDVGFLLAVISDAAAHTPVDLRRVYVTGMSSGGMMAYAMAAQAADRIAAIASSEGSLALPAIHPSRPVPTLEYHSVNDPIVKWSNVMPGIDQWVKADGCNPNANTGLTATLVTYGSCRGGAEVRLWRLTGSGHVWPGAPFNTGPRNTWILDGVGRGTTLVDANEDMWRFFRQHELPA
jgi:polyhydroxybutyrate depolymerase